VRRRRRGIEEASSAMIEGRIASLSALEYLGHAKEAHSQTLKALHTTLKGLRKGPHASKVRTGYEKRGMMYDR
jgi:sarcosine oxidase subunit alpha